MREIDDVDFILFGWKEIMIILSLPEWPFLLYSCSFLMFYCRLSIYLHKRILSLSHLIYFVLFSELSSLLLLLYSFSSINEDRYQEKLQIESWALQLRFRTQDLSFSMPLFPRSRIRVSWCRRLVLSICFLLNQHSFECFRSA